MSNERITEELVLKELNMNLERNDWGYVYPQGSVKNNDKILNLLKNMGGKPKDCSLDNYETKGSGIGKPEFIITFDNDPNLLVVIECKKSTKQHISQDLSHPASYAVDGVLYYAKHMKNQFNILAIAISGTKRENLLVSTYKWHKGDDNYLEEPKLKNSLLEAKNYLKYYNGEKIQKKFSLEETRSLAILMHEKLREIKMTEKQKPIFIAGILIALTNESFANDYQKLSSFSSLMDSLISNINNVLENSDIPKEKIGDLKNQFIKIKTNQKLKDISLNEDFSLRWYVEELENKIKPMMNYTENTLDALSVFYHEFIKYSGGDGKGLGIVLTPQHLTEFMCEIAEVNKNSKVLDICCGSGAFLVTAMSMMFKEASPTEIDNIKKNNLYGVELDDDIYTLAVTNMIVRKDGKSNIINGDCFKKEITEKLKEKNINIGLMNPPYSQKDKCELEFVEKLLDILVVGGKACVVVPMSCAIGTKFKEVRERLFNKHTLRAVFTMPDDIFYPTGTNTCVMLWEAHKPHDNKTNTFFGFYKNDGFVKMKKLGRIDNFNKWAEIKNEWVSLYKNSEVKEGLSCKRCVSSKDEWLCEAYMETDYSTLCEEDFEKTVRDYYSFLIKDKV